MLVNSHVQEFYHNWVEVLFDWLHYWPVSTSLQIIFAYKIWFHKSSPYSDVWYNLLTVVCDIISLQMNNSITLQWYVTSSPYRCVTVSLQRCVTSPFKFRLFDLGKKRASKTNMLKWTYYTKLKKQIYIEQTFHEIIWGIKLVKKYFSGIVIKERCIRLHICKLWVHEEHKRCSYEYKLHTLTDIYMNINPINIHMFI